MTHLVPTVSVLIVSFEDYDAFARLESEFVLVLGFERVERPHFVHSKTRLAVCGAWC